MFPPYNIARACAGFDRHQKTCVNRGRFSTLPAPGGLRAAYAFGHQQPRDDRHPAWWCRDVRGSHDDCSTAGNSDSNASRKSIEDSIALSYAVSDQISNRLQIPWLAAHV
jgi:hypothetical protein